jgi:hypothetical protein
MAATAVGVRAAADVQREAFDAIESADGAAVGIPRPKEMATFRAMRGNGSERLGLGGTRSATGAWHGSGLLAAFSPLFYADFRQVCHRRKKTPAVTVPQVRSVFSELLREPAAGPDRIAEVVNQVLRRKEEARIYHWYAATGEFPPRRPRMDSKSSLGRPFR